MVEIVKRTFRSLPIPKTDIRRSPTSSGAGQTFNFSGAEN